MKPELRLLTGGLSDDEYRSLFDTGAYLLRRDIGRPGWSTRWLRALQTVGYLIFLVLLLGAVLGACVVFAAMTDTLPVPR